MLTPRLGELDKARLARLLRGGLALHMPPFISRIRSSNPTVAGALGGLYGDYALAGGEVADFEVSLEPPSLLRRYWRRQVMADIHTQAPFVPLPADMAPLMMEQSLNWMIATRVFTHLVLHAAVVEKDGQALLLPGESGQGKSTLCAALVARGWRLLSDEFTLIEPESGLVQPCPRPISLKNQSIDVIRDFAPEAGFSAPLTGTPKGRIAYMRPPRNAVLRATEPALPALVLTPRYEAGSKAGLEALPKPSLFMFLTACSVNYRIFGKQGFDAIARLVDHTEARVIRYSDLGSAVELADRLLREAA